MMPRGRGPLQREVNLSVRCADPPGVRSWGYSCRPVRPIRSPAPPLRLVVGDSSLRGVSHPRDQYYGTIVVDLERSDVIDLLPDREADTVATWLKARPRIEVVSRD